VLSRCLQFNLKQIPQPQIRAQLKKILEFEGVAFEDEALALLARAAQGSMRDSLSLLDQAIAHGAGRVEQQAVRAMLGSVELTYLYDILAALQRHDGVALVAVADQMAERSLSFEIALQDLATLLHRIALMQTVPQAIAANDPDHAALAALAGGFGAEEIQLLYQIALHGRQDIGWAPDDYAGFTMTLMRMLAFAPDGTSAAGVSQAAVPAARVAHAPMPMRTAPPAELKKKPIEGDWNALVNTLPLAGMERMLAHNCELVAWQEGRIELRVPHAQRHLNDRAYQDRLQAALEQHLGAKLRLEIGVGPGNGNTPAQVQDRESEQRQRAAAAAIEGDPFVRDLIENLDARVLSSSIKPAPQRKE
jgi:DNA polymerase-3 subunit gamma/tau